MAMKRILITLSAALALCCSAVAGQFYGDNTFRSPGTFTIQSGVALQGFWVFATGSTIDITNATKIGFPSGGGGGTPGGVNTQLQFNAAGGFGGVPWLTYDGTKIIQQGSSKYLIQDPTDTTKGFTFETGNIATGLTRAVNIPDANSTTVQSSLPITNQFLTGVNAQGSFSRAQPAFTNLTGSATNAQLPATISGKTFDDTNTITVKDGSFTIENTAAVGKTVKFDLSNLSTGPPRLIVVPDGNSSTVQAQPALSNNFVTGISASGVLTLGQPAFSNLSGSIALNQFAINTDKLLGRSLGVAGLGAAEEIAIGANLTLAAGVLSAASSALPPMVGNSGKFLTNNGSIASWGDAFVSSITDPVDPTKALQFDIGAFPTATTRTIRPAPSGDSVTVIADLSPPPANQFLTGINLGGIQTRAQPSITNLSSLTGTSKLVGSGAGGSSVGEITLGANLTMLGNVLNAATGGTPASPSGTLQYNNAGVFGSVSSTTTDGTVVTQLAGTNFVLAQPSDTTRRAFFDVSAIAPGQTRTITVPNVGGTLIVPDSGAVANQFLTSINVGGVISRARPTVANLTDASAVSKLIGSSSTGNALGEITLGSNLSMSGSTLNATGGGGGTPGGSSSQVQYNSGGTAFGGITTMTTDGTVVTQLAGTNFVLADPTDSTKKATFTISGATGLTKAVNIPGSNSTTVVPDSGAANSFFNSLTGAGVLTKTRPTITNLTDLSGTQKIVGSNTTDGKVVELTLGTNLSMTGSTINATSTTTSPGGSNTQLQYNNAGAFGGISTATFSGGLLSLKSNATQFQNNTDSTKTFLFDTSNIPTSTQLTVNIPSANSTTVVASSAPSNQFATGINATTGVISYAQPSIGNLPPLSGGGMLVGSGLPGTGTIGEITLGTGLSMSGTTLNATGAVGGSNTQVQYNNSGVLGGITGATTNGTKMTLTSPDITTGFTIGNAAASGKIPQGDGTKFAASSATFPTTAGTSGNVMTSDGTNWTSTAPASGTYILQGGSFTALSPADGITYYLGWGSGAALSAKTLYANAAIPIPKTGTIKAVYFRTYIVTNGSTETVSHILRLNDTTDTTLSSTETWNPGANTTKLYSYTGLTVAVTAGDTVALKIICPTWTTNPTLGSSEIMIVVQ